ncbi:hypothetical protein FOIG_09637 [Fusarium odoratissimum NRRL 54006]|uniref:DUF7918 domain-containing protein n=2 Tax=Fusarium oxysporum species complex TaxID=171631 RepID=X0JA27_FUSO5|nr:uncharacterized protein FOIG_09637 [Fusarium odoratissimum NRRL 54006]EXL98078.1 hypothetical protein FOIG_09637 [Fusarium odoratissimum NRRL 54006]TXB95416.1 hypothetical protein FocTR4_00016692 [Fusarium oxysporum f. sp. cubense]
MAILPFTPGINVAVLVDGEPAKEYQPWEFPEPFDATMNQGIPHTKCYVKSQAGSPYAIRFRISSVFTFPNDTDAVTISVYVDGKPFDNKCIRKSTLAGASNLGIEYVGEISYCQRDFSDGSSKSYRPVFGDIRPVDEADSESVNTDLERIKALGTIQVAIEVGKQIAPVPMGNDDFSDDKRNESLAIDNKALLLNGHGQIHGTTYTKTDETRQMTYTTVDDEQHLGNLFFFYLSCHSPGAQFFFQSRFIDRFADDMIHILSLPKVKHMLNEEV